MIIDIGTAGGFLTNQHCRCSVVDTRASPVSLPYGTNPSSSGQRGPKWKALSTLSDRVQVLLYQSTIASRSRCRSKCAAGCALIRGRQLKPPSELERVVISGAERGKKGAGESDGTQNACPPGSVTLCWRGRCSLTRTSIGGRRVCSVTGVCETRCLSGTWTGWEEEGVDPDWKSWWNFGWRMVAIGLAMRNN